MQELYSGILDALKAVYKVKSVTIIVEEDERYDELMDEQIFAIRHNKRKLYDWLRRSFKT